MTSYSSPEAHAQDVRTGDAIAEAADWLASDEAAEMEEDHDANHPHGGKRECLWCQLKRQERRRAARLLRTAPK